jgi:hypothetical protein
MAALIINIYLSRREIAEIIAQVGTYTLIEPKKVGLGTISLESASRQRIINDCAVVNLPESKP